MRTMLKAVIETIADLDQFSPLSVKGYGPRAASTDAETEHGYFDRGSASRRVPGPLELPVHRTLANLLPPYPNSAGKPVSGIHRLASRPGRRGRVGIGHYSQCLTLAMISRKVPFEVSDTFLPFMKTRERLAVGHRLTQALAKVIYTLIGTSADETDCENKMYLLHQSNSVSVCRELSTKKVGMLRA